MPELRTVIAYLRPDKVAWFKVPDGKILSLVQEDVKRLGSTSSLTVSGPERATGSAALYEICEASRGMATSTLQASDVAKVSV